MKNLLKFNCIDSILINNLGLDFHYTIKINNLKLKKNDLTKIFNYLENENTKYTLEIY